MPDILSLPRRYALSLIATAVAILWTVLFWPLCQYFPFGLFLVAVLFCAWFGRTRQGLVATGLSLVVLAWIYFRFLYPNQPEQWEGSLVRLVLFALVGVIATFLSRQCRGAVDAVDGFHGTLASFGDAVISTDVEGRITSMNVAAEKLTGWSRTEARDKPWSQVARLLHDGTHEPLADPIHKSLHDAAPVDLGDNTRLASTSGRELPVEGRAGPLRDSRRRVVGVVLTLRDASQRRLAESSLRQSEQEYRAMIAAAPTGLLLLDAKGRCTFTNPACQATCGFSADEGLGEGWARAISSSDRNRVVGEWLSAVQTVQNYSSEFRIQPRQGGMRWVRLRSAPMLADNGHVVGHVGLLEDFTEHKLLGDSLHEQQSLQAEQRRLEDELRQARADHERQLSDHRSERIRLEESLRQTQVDHHRQLQDRLVEQRRLEEAGRSSREGFERELANRQAELVRSEESLRRQREEYERHMAECAPRQKRAEEALSKAREDLERHLVECMERQRRAEETMRTVDAEWERKFQEHSIGQRDVDELLRLAQIDFQKQLDERATAQRRAEEALQSSSHDFNRMIDEQAAQHDMSLAELREQLVRKQQLFDQQQLELDALRRSQHELDSLRQSQDADLSGYKHHADLLARQETRLRQEKEQLNQIIEKSRDGVMAFDREHRLLVWNTVMERLTGRSKEEVLGHSVFDIFTGLREQDEARPFNEVLAGEQPRARLDALRPIDADSDHAGFIEAAFAPLHGGDAEIVGGMALVRERTQRKPVTKPVKRPTEEPTYEPMPELTPLDLDSSLMTVLVSEMPMEGELATEALRRPWPGWERSHDWLAYN